MHVELERHRRRDDLRGAAQPSTKTSTRKQAVEVARSQEPLAPVGCRVVRCRQQVCDEPIARPRAKRCPRTARSSSGTSLVGGLASADRGADPVARAADVRRDLGRGELEDLSADAPVRCSTASAAASCHSSSIRGATGVVASSICGNSSWMCRASVRSAAAKLLHLDRSAPPPFRAAPPRRFRSMRGRPAERSRLPPSRGLVGRVGASASAAYAATRRTVSPLGGHANASAPGVAARTRAPGASKAALRRRTAYRASRSRTAASGAGYHARAVPRRPTCARRRSSAQGELEERPTRPA